MLLTKMSKSHQKFLVTAYFVRKYTGNNTFGKMHNNIVKIFAKN